MTINMQLLLTGARALVNTPTAAPQSRIKAAADIGMLQSLLDGGRSLVNKVDTNNPLHTGAIGAGVGALGGLAGSALSSEDEEEKSPLQAALMGGLVGGGVGAGTGMLNQHRSSLQPHATPDTHTIAAMPPGQSRTQPRLPPADPFSIPRAPARPPVPASPPIAAAVATKPKSLLSYMKSKRQPAQYPTGPAPVLATAD